MKLPSIHQPLTIGGGAKILLAATGSLQGFIDRPGITHEFCNRQAVIILNRDGLSSCAAFCSRYLSELNNGVYWADTGWKNVGHYLQTGTNKGLWRFPSAIEEFRCYFGRALNYACRGGCEKAMFYLGAAAHLAQDLCVPHHARAKMLDGHKQYEGWAVLNHWNYAIESAGIYSDCGKAEQLLMNNAAVAADLFSWVRAGASRPSYHKATAVLLPLAQQTTAGLFWRFFTAAGAVLHAA